MGAATASDRMTKRRTTPLVTVTPYADAEGGSALLEFAMKPAARKGRLHWLLTPAQLRVLAE